MDDERLDDEGLLFLEMRSELGHADGTCVAGINPCGTRSLYRGARVRRAPVNANEATLVWVDEYSRMAEAYDQNVAPRFEPIAQEVVHLADPKPNELFLDVGTGTGLLACLLAPRVQGCDRRESMKKEFPVRFASHDELVRFAASYGFYERELREMPPESHKAFDAELAARLRPLTTSAGIEDIWTVNFFIAHPE